MGANNVDSTLDFTYKNAFTGKTEYTKYIFISKANKLGTTRNTEFY